MAELSNCGAGASFTWNFGDQSAVATGQTSAHSYNAPGTYLVTLIVSHPPKGVAKLTKSVMICGPYVTRIDIVRGTPDVDCCTTPNLEAVVLYAHVIGQCHQVASYQWQMQTMLNGVWTNLANQTRDNFSFSIHCGATRRYRCIIITIH